MGNYDDGVGFGRPTCGCDFASQGDEHDGHLSLEWTKAQLGNDQLKFLRSLPHRMQRTFRGVNVTLTHGSMGAINEYLTQDTGDESALENVTLAGGGVLAVGHTHVPYVRVTPEGMLVNCGSVGRPKHGDPRASYVLLTFGRGKAGAEIQYVTYDHEAAAREVAAAGLPQAFAALLRRGY
jgi:predicted phosphodiesterase